jgi:hypothetical protein
MSPSCGELDRLGYVRRGTLRMLIKGINADDRPFRSGEREVYEDRVSLIEEKLRQAGRELDDV